MSKLRALHITPWFPKKDKTLEGIFIAEHIKALNTHCDNKVLHIEFGTKKKTETDTFETIKVDRLTLKPLFDKWIFKEKLAYKSIVKYLKANHQKFDVINFYITYPNAIYINKIVKLFPNIKFCMTEQWSAYHTQFNLPKKNKGRKRIENIFNNSIPLFTVSNALGKDIQDFIGDINRQFEVIPNCIDIEKFYYRKLNVENEVFTFTSINTWSEMKNPFVLLETVKYLIKKHKNIRLILGGNGLLLNKIEKDIERLGIEKNVQVLGRVPKENIPKLLANSNVYCQSSYYETFSAICLESLALGTPVIATNVGGMRDFINKENGVLVDGLEKEKWFEALELMYLNYEKYNKELISKKITEKYNSKSIGELFYLKLKNIVHG